MQTFIKEHKNLYTVEFLESSTWPSNSPDSLVVLEVVKTRSSAIYNFRHEYWFHDFILGYQDLTELISYHNGFKRTKNEQ